MSLTVLRAAERVPVPWKNRGGITRDVAASGGVDDFVWRVSIAEIARPGPFSNYPGVDRQFVVLDGWLRLSIDGRPQELSPRTPPLAFPGEAAVSSEPLAGPVQALNVMTRRGQARAALRRVRSGDLTPTSGTMLLIATGPAGTRCAADEWESLGRYDAVRIGPPCTLALDGEGWLISLSN